MRSRETSEDHGHIDGPYLPNRADRANLSSFPLRPAEAHYLLVNSETLDDADRRALRSIVDGDFHPDQELDFLSAGREPLTLDGGYHEDDDDDLR